MKAGISSAPIFLLALFMMTIQLGCSNGPDLRDIYSANIKKLHACYVMYLEDHEFKGPKDEAELKNYLKTNPTAVHLIKKIDLTPENVDDIFIGERDGEPFVVRYGLVGVADHAIVFEATGVEGMRIVALANPTEFGKQEYDDYLSGKTKPEFAADSEGFGVEGE